MYRKKNLTLEGDRTEEPKTVRIKNSIQLENRHLLVSEKAHIFHKHVGLTCDHRSHPKVLPL